MVIKCNEALQRNALREIERESVLVKDQSAVRE